jgi:Na+-driven multidrug efflux pump
MYMVVLMAMFGLALPTWVVLGLFHQGIYAAWTVATFYVCILGLAYFARFLAGKWKHMRVIEPQL